LSHFYFAPKPEVQELGVKPIAVASISMEEILPTARVVSSTSTSLAPEQIHEKKRGRDAAFLSAGEADRDDRQRLRRASKAARNKSRKSDALELGINRSIATKKDKRIVVADNSSTNSKKFAKSANFFSELQKNVSAGVNNKVQKKSSSQEVRTDSSQTLKL
jgi:U3 small nucleolar ribonucleoprotein component